MNGPRGILYFDASCGICAAGATRLERMLLRRGFALEPLQSPGACELLGLAPGTVPDEIQLRTRDARIVRGADAMIYIARQIWWAWPMWVIARMPGAMPVLRKTYARIARNRHRISGACAVRTQDSRSATARWLPPAIFAGAAMLVGRALVPWLYMWLLAYAIFIACKWITFWPHRRAANIGGAIAYFLAYPGLDARPFLSRRQAPRTRDQRFSDAIILMIGGAVLIWLVARSVATSHPILATWCVMAGLALLLHFGILQIIALVWRRRGLDVAPLMDRPARSATLGEFWGQRWNTAFSSAARDVVFEPIAHRLGAGAAMTVVFLVSGIIHDVVISLPARGGYGLPTLYFLIQLAGIFLARRTRLSRDTLITRAYAVAFVIVPLPLLFHVQFVTRVMLPFARAIGSF